MLANMLQVEGWSYLMEKLSEIKKSIPVQAAFATAQGIGHEPAFNWRVKHVLNKRVRAIVYLKKSNNFGIELSKTVEQAYALYAKNGNTLWADATSK